MFGKLSQILSCKRLKRELVGRHRAAQQGGAGTSLKFFRERRLLHLGVEVLDDGDIVTDLMDLNPPRSSSESPPPLRILHLDVEVLDDGDIVTDLLSKILARLGSK